MSAPREPRPFDALLRRAVSRARWRNILAGASAGVVVAAAVIATGLVRGSTARLVVITALFEAIGIAVALLTSRVSASRVTQEIETRVPQSRNLLVTAEEIRAGRISAPPYVSDRVMDQASALATRVDLTTAVPVRRWVAVALAAGPMVMINAATGFRRVDSAKIALARSYGASTLQIFWKIRAPMALPMILVGLMIGAIFGLLTAVGAEMVGGGFGLGNRLTTYSSMIQMPQFFAVVLILSTLGILIYVLFFLIGKKWASWEA